MGTIPMVVPIPMVLLLFVVVCCQTVSVGVMSSVADGDSYHAASPLPNGGYVATWTYGTRVYVQRFNEAGTAQMTSPRQANAYGYTVVYPVYNASAPCIAGLENNGYVVAWMTQNQDSDNYGIFAQIFDKDDLYVGGEFSVNTYVVNKQQDPACAALVGGGFVISWASMNQDGSSLGIFAQKYSAYGGRQGLEFQVNSQTSDMQSSQQVVGTLDGGFAVTWVNYYGSATVYLKAYDANGAATVNDVVASTGSDDKGQPSIAVQPDGTLIVSWYEDHPDKSSSVVARLFSADLVAMTTVFTVSGSDAKQPSKATIVPMYGMFFVAWQDYYTGSADFAIFGRLVLQTGQLLGSVMNLTPTSGMYYTAPTAAKLTTGNKAAIIIAAAPMTNSAATVVSKFAVTFVPPTCQPLMTANAEEVVGSDVDSTFAMSTGNPPLADIPTFLYGASALFLPSLPLTPYTRIVFRCCSTASVGCDIFVAMPHCPPCTTSINGGFPTSLPADGWSAASCAPTFTSSYITSAVTFHKRLTPGQTYTLPAATSNVDYVAFFGRQGVVENIFCPVSPEDYSTPAATCMPCSA